MAGEASFDIVSDYDRQELVNAVDQTHREMRHRYRLPRESGTQKESEQIESIQMESTQKDTAASPAWMPHYQVQVQELVDVFGITPNGDLGAWYDVAKDYSDAVDWHGDKMDLPKLARACKAWHTAKKPRARHVWVTAFREWCRRSMIPPDTKQTNRP
jgi:Protein of unknown function (DUF520)